MKAKGATTVEFWDGQRAPVRVISSAPGADIALLQAQAVPSAAAPASLADSDAARIGDRVFIIGAPYGVSHTLTVGHLSGRHRPGQTTAGLGHAELLQTDAAINKGNAGGANVQHGRRSNYWRPGGPTALSTRRRSAARVSMTPNPSGVSTVPRLAPFPGTERVKATPRTRISTPLPQSASLAPERHGSGFAAARTVTLAYRAIVRSQNSRYHGVRAGPRAGQLFPPPPGLGEGA
jgi:hypothetical protein